ncbi:hypothetical protein [Blautia hansenii]|uniref:Uncharacterized protein n=1 Tax=Blautia hansenii DSM 20583 TaxID=537007 RepID=C9L787_BLAHA|nr:hypothetical protein [Blautia hansenii]ASM69932.1 hypothetical protein CGC63_10340 [Blautia hansenii DSM 20583]EEX22281.1 hypothetical protein BLAHAN_05249 [Blautia hansenii DSM 20583]UWO09690.1 hypothetical protein NQ538_10430 [Blautia hansenii DSM 20583]
MIDTFTDYILADISSPITLLLLLVVSIYFIGKFLFKNWGNIKSYFENSYQNRKKKEELYETVEVLQKAKDDIIAETKALSQAQKDFYDEQLKYRNVSQQLRDSLQEKTDIAVKKSEEALNEIKELHLILEQIQTRQEEIDADRKSQKVNELRQDLINAYHYFTSVERNPKQEWNEMEAHAFWSMFGDYERYGGNDFAHRVIQPAMNKLKIIPITQED